MGTIIDAWWDGQLIAHPKIYSASNMSGATGRIESQAASRDRQELKQTC